VIALKNLPDFLETWIENQKVFATEPRIHCFVARSQLGCDLDACETQSGLTLGNQYPLVVRMDVSQSPTIPQYYNRWRNKWKSLERKAQATVQTTAVRSDSRKLPMLFKQLKKAEIGILENLDSDRIDAVFQFLSAKVALPVALWVRKDDLYSDIDRILDCTVMDLPERVLEERQASIGDEEKTSLGYHLGLIWDDPEIPLLTAEQIDPEQL
jgi:hypothetical protein